MILFELYNKFHNWYYNVSPIDWNSWHFGPQSWYFAFAAGFLLFALVTYFDGLDDDGMWFPLLFFSGVVGVFFYLAAPFIITFGGLITICVLFFRWLNGRGNARRKRVNEKEEIRKEAQRLLGEIK